MRELSLGLSRAGSVLLMAMIVACGGGHHGSADGGLDGGVDADAGPPSPEICGNGLDDDGDGDVDCADVDCLTSADGAPLDVVASFADAVRFLYTDGACDAPQQGVAPGTLDDEARLAVLRGRVLQDGVGVGGVRVEVLSHPEYGHSFTHGDGSYDMVVLSGAPLTVRLQAEGMVPGQRTAAQVRPHRFAHLADLTLTPREAPVSVDLGGGMAMAEAAPVTDADGTRQLLALFPSGVTAQADMGGGVMAPLPSNLHLRMTELTRGEDGPSRMPADLPETSAYTYAFELSVDEAEAMGADHVVFDQPVPVYTDNFLHMPVGTPVPFGTYDEEAGRWVAEPDGVVLAIVGEAAGLAELDLTGDGVADPEMYAAWRITDDERRELSATRSIGDELWRVTMTHFTVGDTNWPKWLNDLVSPRADKADDASPGQCPVTARGSIIRLNQRALGETMPVAGTSYALHYESDRHPGFLPTHSLDVGVGPETLPDSLVGIQVTLRVAGRSVTQQLEPSTDARFQYVWDGDDVYGRRWQQEAHYQLEVVYQYGGDYAGDAPVDPGFDPFASEGSFGRGGSLDLHVGARGLLLATRRIEGTLSFRDERDRGLMGFSLDARDQWRAEAGRVLFGAGDQRDAEAVPSVISRAAGGGSETAPGSPARDFDFGGRLRGLAVGPDGSVYLSVEERDRVYRIDPEDRVWPFAGTGTRGSNGDGGPATSAELTGPRHLTVASDGSVYIATAGQRIRRVAPDGSITTVAGTGVAGGDGAGGPGVDAQVQDPRGLSLGPDGSLYFADASGIRALRPSGLLVTLNDESFWDGGQPGTPLRQANVGVIGTLAVDARGDLYVGGAGRVVRFGAGQLLEPFAGGERRPSGLDDVGFGGPALEARLPFATTGFALLAGPDGSVYIGMGNVLMVVGPSGILHHMAGSGPPDLPTGDGGAATAATLFGLEQVALDADGSLLLIDNNSGTLRRVRRALGTRSFSEFALPLGGGALGVFDSYGYQTRVVDPFTGATLRSFTHGALGALEGVTDRDLGELRVSRSAGQVVLRAPGGQETTLFDDDDDGYADRVEYAGGPSDSGALPAATQFRWDEGGLASSMVDPSGTVHAYGYDERGQLVSDQLGDEPAQRISGSAIATATTRGAERVLTSSEGHDTTLRLEQTLDGELRSQMTQPDGTQQTSARSTAWEVTQSDALGSMTQTLVADPVLGAGAAYPAHTQLSLGSHTLQVDTAVMGEVDPTSTQIASWRSTTTLARGTPLEATTSRAWDAEMRTWTLTSAEGRVVEVELDTEGHALSMRPGGLAETRFEYDASGRLSRASRTDGADTRELSLGYDGENRWAASATDGAMATSSIGHDGLGRPTTLTEPSTETASLGYEDTTRTLSVTGFGAAAAHQLASDPAGRLASYTPPAVSGATEGTTRYAYDADGVLTALTLPDGGSVSVTTDAAGRPASMTLSAGTLTLAYDGASGQLASMSMPNTAGEQALALSYDGPLLTQQRFTGPATADVDYAYDDLLRVSSVSVAGEAIDYTYDRDGLVTGAGAETLTRDPVSGVVSATTAGSVRQGYITTGLGEQVQHSAVWPGGGLFGENVNARDGAGRILDVAETTSGASFDRGYRYDADGRVTEERRDGVRIASYVYDAQGNRTELHRYDATTGAETESRTATYDARDRLVDDGIASYTYDDAGRRATKTTTAGDVTRYAYDELGHLTRVELPTGVTVEYTYDALGRRTGRTTDGAVDGAFDTAWVYGSGPAPIAKLDGLGNLHVAYVYGTRSWVPDLVIVPDAAGVRAQLALITDHRGSVRTMVETRTNATIPDIDYDAFGRPTSPPPAILTYYGFAFAGGTLDADTGLLHLGARDYDPETGTWIEPDPIRFAGGDTNLYAYVGGDPVNAVDPSGLWEFAFGASVDGQYGLGVTLGAGIGIENFIDSSGHSRSGVYGVLPVTGASMTDETNGGLIVSAGISVNIAFGSDGATWCGTFNNVTLAAGAYSATVFWGAGSGPKFYGISFGLGVGVGVARYQTNTSAIWQSSSANRCDSSATLSQSTRGYNYSRIPVLLRRPSACY